MHNHNLIIIFLLLPKLFQSALGYGRVADQHGILSNLTEWPILEIANSSSVVEQKATQVTPQNGKYEPQDFSKLKLKVGQLLGSRWAIEQRTPIDVYHAIEVVDTTLITKDELILRIEFNLRQTWVAEGLEFPEGLFKDDDTPQTFVTAGESVLADMWSPDSYISTSRESNMNTVGTPLSLVYIYKNATIIFKVRMFTKVACSSSFRWYPLDIQTCDLTIESYKHHSDVVRYHWTDENLYRPVVIHKRRLFQYDLQMPPKFDSGEVTRGGRGMNYSYVRIKFRFERKLGNNMIQVYTPTVLVVVLSWFSFWLGLDAIPGRISLLVTCMLTLVTMHSGLKNSIPAVHYITLMDIWYVCCMTFVFSGMTEFVIAKYLHWRHQQRIKLEENKSQEETRARIYSMVGHYHEQHQYQTGGGSEGDWGGHRNRSSLSARSLPGRSELLLVNEAGGTSVVPSYWAQALEAGRHRRNAVTGDCSNQLLKSIIVGAGGRGGAVPDVDIEIGRDTEDNIKLGDEEEGKLAKDKGGGGADKHKFPIWVAMDRYCRAFLPALFALFNLVYWPLLFIGSAGQDTDVYVDNAK